MCSLYSNLIVNSYLVIMILSRDILNLYLEAARDSMHQIYKVILLTFLL